MSQRCIVPAALLGLLLALTAPRLAAQTLTDLEGGGLPEGWTVATGALAEGGPGLTPRDGRPLTIHGPTQSGPGELIVRLQLHNRDILDITATPRSSPPDSAPDTAPDTAPGTTSNPVPPAFYTRLNRFATNSVDIIVKAHDKPLPATAPSVRNFPARFTPHGRARYGWRYDTIGNLWDDRDRAEIGSSYEALTPFDEKWLVLRFVMGPERQQVWIDDRMIAESVGPLAASLQWAFTLRGGARLMQVEQRPLAADHDTPFIALALDDYRSDGRPRPAGDAIAVEAPGIGSVPVRLTAPQTPDFDLGATLYRHRLTEGSGPNAPYVNGKTSWPSPLEVDPVVLAFRVPYRDYREAYLAVYDDREPGSVPRGVFRFYREQAGFTAATEFELTEAAKVDGRAIPTGRKTPDGHDIWLLRVPVDTAGLYGFNDFEGHYLNIQLSKPTMLGRSYPDPIYYGTHAAGLPSSLHVVGMTLVEGPLRYRVVPTANAHIFEQPEKPSWRIDLRNHTAAPLPVTVELKTRSHDGAESHTLAGKTTLAPQAEGAIDLALDHVRTLGWHGLDVRVTAGNASAPVELTSTHALVLLPPNDRTYGDSMQETRFGAWDLLGHYVPLTVDREANEPVLKMYRRLGIRRISYHDGFLIPEMARKYDLLPGGPHTLVSVYHRLDETDAEQVANMLIAEWKGLVSLIDHDPNIAYYFGGEWGFDHNYTHAVNPRYTGGGPWPFDDKAMASLNRQKMIFTAIGRMMCAIFPTARLVLQWGGPQNTIPFLEHGFPKELVDAYGMDMPMFELQPEVPVAVGTINVLWTLRQEVARTGWPQHPIYWVEGPFLPTNQGALTEQQQADHYARYFLHGLAYGIERFEAGIVPHDAGNYYGAEHYGAGVIHRNPLEYPKPAVAAIATTTRMVCGYDVVGPVAGPVPTTLGLAFEHMDTKARRYAFWRVRGESDLTLKVTGNGPFTVTDAMGNTREVAAADGALALTVSPSPVWLSGPATVEVAASSAPRYEAPPVAIRHSLPPMSAEHWQYDGQDIPSYSQNHLGISRVTDPALRATFDQQLDVATPAEGQPVPAAVVELPAQSAGDRTLAARYGALVLKQPAAIPGSPAALGVWVNGNASWGRIAYQVRDAQGEVWTSIGTPNDWNCDDTHGWSHVSFEGPRYVRFPLPGNMPYDKARTLESTWWKHEGGDGIVDLPLQLEKIFVEARNETLVLGQAQLIEDRDYALWGLVAEYESASDASEAAVELHRRAMPTPQWQGPHENLLGDLARSATRPAPAPPTFEEPHQWNDGRRMIIHFQQEEGLTYRLYLARYPDGRGAELLRPTVRDNDMVTGLRPGVEMYLFLTSVDAKKDESKPSAGVKLVTEDKFAEK